MQESIDQYDIAAFSNGDLEILTKLYNHFYNRMVFYAVKLTGSQDQSEDIVVASFTKLWEKRVDFRSFESVKSYLYTVVRNDCFKYYNHQKVKLANERGIIAAMEGAAYKDFAESRIVLTEIIAQLHEQINRLPPKYQELVKLVYIEEYSSEEASAHLKISPATFRKRKERALKMLKNQLITKDLFVHFYFFTFLSQNMN